MHVIEINLDDILGEDRDMDARSRAVTGMSVKEINSLPKEEKRALLKKVHARVVINPEARMALIDSIVKDLYALMTSTDPEMTRKVLSAEKAFDLEMEHKFRDAGLNPAVELTGIRNEEQAEATYAESMKRYRRKYALVEAFLKVRPQLADAIRELGLPADIEDCFKEDKCASEESQSRN